MRAHTDCGWLIVMRLFFKFQQPKSDFFSIISGKYFSRVLKNRFDWFPCYNDPVYCVYPSPH